MAQEELTILVRVRDQATRALKSLNNAAKDVVETGGKGIAGLIRGAGAALSGPVGKLLALGVAVVGVRRIARWGSATVREMIRVGSAAQEAESALSFVFGEESARVQQRILGQAAALGRFSVELQEFNVQVAGLGKNAGLSINQVDKLGEITTQLSIDLASFFNRRDSEAFTAFLSGLRGESEPLRKFGVDLRESVIQQEALRRGLNVTGRALTEQEKLLLRLSAATRQASDQIGDAARTQDQFANQTKRIGATIQELRLRGGRTLIAAIEASIAEAGGVDEILKGIATTFAAVVALSEKLLDVAIKGAGVIEGLKQKLLDLGGIPKFLRGAPSSGNPLLDILGVDPDQFVLDANDINATIDELFAKLRENPALSPVERDQSFVAERERLEAQISRTTREQIDLLGAQFAAERERIAQMGVSNGLLASQKRLLMDLVDQTEDQTRAQLEQQLVQENINREIVEHNGLLQITDRSLASATDNIVAYAQGTKKADDAFADFAQSFLSNILRMIVQTQLLRGTIALLSATTSISTTSLQAFFGIASAKGNAFDGGGVIPFASGGAFTNSIVSSPTMAPLALFGEKGPEGILPLDRMSNGDLGVRASGSGGGTTIVLQASFLDTRGADAWLYENRGALGNVLMQQLKEDPALRGAVHSDRVF